VSHTDLTLLYNLYEQSAGRRIFALVQVRDRALARGLAEVVSHVDAAIEHDRATRQLDLRWEPRDQPAAIDAAVQPIDIRLDRSLSAMRDVAVAQAEVAKPGDGVAEQVDSFLHEVFPSGVGAVTSLPYIEQLAVVEQIVAKLQGPLAAVVTELGLTRQANRVAELCVEYRNALFAQQNGPAWSVVRAARARGQELLLETVALIIAHTRGGTAEDAAARAELLTPILKQNEEIRQYMRARRKVEDVDPTTGEVEPGTPPAIPAPEATPAPPPA